MYLVKELPAGNQHEDFAAITRRYTAHNVCMVPRLDFQPFSADCRNHGVQCTTSLSPARWGQKSIRGLLKVSCLLPLGVPISLRMAWEKH